MRVLLTGAAGFLGGYTIGPLKSAGHEVITTDKRGQVAITGDLALPEFCASLPEVEAVVHCAAVHHVSPDLSLLNRRRYFEANNVTATINLAERYKNAAVHFVNVGTSMMYRQDGSAVYHSGSTMAPQGVYSSSKLRAHAALLAQLSNWATVVPCIIGGVGREGLFRRSAAAGSWSARASSCLTVADDFTHECVDIAADYGIGGQYVARLPRDERACPNNHSSLT